jgi:competence protein ComEC
MAAMLLGERSGVDAELKELYRRSGIAHILAISGMHVSLIGAAVLAILLRLGLSRRTAAVVSIILMFFYGLLTGFAPATLRAVWMLTAVNLSGVFRRTADLPTSAGLSMFLILMVQPYRISSTGMLMSFLSVAGVVAGAALYERIFGRNRFMSVPVRLRSGVKRLVGGLLFGLTIQLFLLPVVLREYFAVTSYGLLLNLIVIPLLSVAVASGVTALLISLLHWLKEDLNDSFTFLKTYIH